MKSNKIMAWVPLRSPSSAASVSGTSQAAIAKHKADYIMWMTWWPFSALWTLLNDPIKRISRIIYQNLSAMMGRMSAAVFAGRFTELK